MYWIECALFLALMPVEVWNAEQNTKQKPKPLLLSVVV
jgi:hypothetical protein